jgi:hypothetical protein
MVTTIRQLSFDLRNGLWLLEKTVVDQLLYVALRPADLASGLAADEGAGRIADLVARFLDDGAEGRWESRSSSTRSKATRRSSGSFIAATAFSASATRSA